MANFKVHFAVGAGVGIAANVIKQATQKTVHPARDFDWLEMLAWGAGGAVLASLPDLLEPATHPRHRGFFHSLVFAGLIGFVLRTVWRSERVRREHREFFGLSGLAYLSHLALDFITPFGLPFI